MTPTNARPNIFNYMNVFQFLQDVYTFRKQRESSFSYETWARELSIKSKTHVRYLVLGERKLAEPWLDLFSQNLQLSETESQYLDLLAAYTQSSSPSHKRRLVRQLMDLAKTDHPQVEIEPFEEFLSNPLLPIIHNLLTYSDITRKEEELAALTEQSVETIRKGLSQLTKLNLVTFDEVNQTWTAKDTAIRISERPGEKAIELYHREALKRSEKGFQFETNIRKFRTMMFPLSEAEFEDFLTDLQDFTGKQLSKRNSSGLVGRRVYQFHVNLVPVSKKVPGEASPEASNNMLDS